MKRALNGLSLTAREELKSENINVSVVYPYITDTNFYKNIMGKPRKSVDVRNDSNLPPPDTSENVASLVLEAINSSTPELFAHDWMEK